jgi:hypothetical protein
MTWGDGGTRDRREEGIAQQISVIQVNEPGNPVIEIPTVKWKEVACSHTDARWGPGGRM